MGTGPLYIFFNVARLEINITIANIFLPTLLPTHKTLPVPAYANTAVLSHRLKEAVGLLCQDNYRNYNTKKRIINEHAHGIL